MSAMKFNLPLKENKMSFDKLIGRRMSKPVKFMGEEIKISKLSVAQIIEIQTAAKDAEKDDAKGFEILKTIIKCGAEGAGDISDENFGNFPMDELSSLSNEIMKYSGIDAGKAK